jgi:hypothetical protein
MMVETRLNYRMTTSCQTEGAKSGPEREDKLDTNLL